MEWICLIKQFNSIASQFLLTKNKNSVNQAVCTKHSALWRIFSPFPPGETHFMKQESPSFKSMDIKGNEGLQEDLTSLICCHQFDDSRSIADLKKCRFSVGSI
jgi:hypothetical protein